MKKSLSPRKSSKNKLVCLVLFVCESAIIITCFFIEASSWHNSALIPSIKAKLFVGISLIVILLLSLLICLFFRRLTLDKKILIMLGFIAIALGIIGTSGFVFEKEISFIDSVYKTFQLFVGEFGDLDYTVGSFPIMLNISRFLALFVTFGAIIVLLLREKLQQLNIRLFYKDIVILTDKIDKRITSLTDCLSENNRKIVIGLLSAEPKVEFNTNGNVPVIEFNSDKNLGRAIQYCNIKKSQCIYLLCESTSDNITVLRAIQDVYKDIPFIETYPADSSIEKPESEILEKLSDKLFKALRGNDTSSDKSAVAKQTKRKCFIQYNSYSEKEYYSMDKSLSGDFKHFETYFINPESNALRQMISRIDLWHLTHQVSPFSAESASSSLNGLKIGIAGSGSLLEDAVLEIPRLCSFGSNTKFNLYHLTTESIFKSIITGHPGFNEITEIFPVSLTGTIKKFPAINLLFICSDNEMQIKNILHSVFQNNIHKSVREIIILTENNRIEFEILKKYVKNIVNSYGSGNSSSGETSVNILLGNSVDLFLSIDDFYALYGPDIRHVHDSYRKSISNGIISDFGKLPEKLIESNLLASIHNKLLVGMLSGFCKNIDNIAEFDMLIDFLAISEHERWYKERILQGYILADEHDYLLNKNPYLVHWNLIDEDIKEKNRIYLINSLLDHCEKHCDSSFDKYLDGFITRLQLRI